MEKSTLLKGLVGSHVYGYATESSDKDYMSVYISPLDHYFGLNKSSTSMTVTDSEDNCEYEFLKFVKLCSSFNPNVIPLLWSNKETQSDNWYLALELITNRHLFVTKLAYNTLVGYSVSQREKARKQLTGKLGEKRKDLIEKYGFDVKSAAHTVRLLKTAEHLFKYNEVELDVAAEECAEYRSGKYSWEDFEDRFEVLKNNVDLSFQDSTLPEKPDMDKVNNLCVTILKCFHFKEN